MKRRILTKLSILVLVFAFMGGSFASAHAAYAVEVTPANGTSGCAALLAVEAEETVWYFRVLNNGVTEKRLWSITNRIWLTDWMPAY